MWKYKIKDRLLKIVPKFCNKWHNPYYYWWKVRKYVRRPKAHLIKGEFHGYFGLPCRTDSYKGLQFFCRGLGWKSKWDSPRHEWDPIICFIFTLPWKTWVNNEYGKEINSKGKKGYYHKASYWFGWVFNWIDKNDENSGTRSMATWEMILDMTIWNKPVEEAEAIHHWSSNYDPETKAYESIIRPVNNLTIEGTLKVLKYENNSRSSDNQDS